MSASALETTIEAAWEDREKLSPATTGAVREAIEATLDALDGGTLRVAEKRDGGWHVNQWAKKAVLLSFRINDMSALVPPTSRVMMLGREARRATCSAPTTPAAGPDRAVRTGTSRARSGDIRPPFD